MCCNERVYASELGVNRRGEWGVDSLLPPRFWQKSAEGIEKKGDEFLGSAKECARV